MPRASRSAPAISTSVRTEVAGSDVAGCAAPRPVCGWAGAAFGATSEVSVLDEKPTGPAVAPPAGPVPTPAAGGVGAGTAIAAGLDAGTATVPGLDSGTAAAA